jgi:hypothetical protein
VTGVTFTAGAGWSCALAAGNIVCSKASLPANTTQTAVSIVANVPGTLAAGTILYNNVTISGGGNDPVPGNNTFLGTTTVYRTRRP